MAENSLSSPIQRAAFLAATSQHSGDWLFALPIASCGLRLDDEAIRIAIGVRLGLQLCIPHRCPCGAQVDAHGRHSFICKRALGRTIRHHHLNELVPFRRRQFLTQRNRKVCVGPTANAQMASLWFLGKVGSRSYGTSQSSVHWRTLMWPWRPGIHLLQRRWRHPTKLPSMLDSCLITISS